METSVQGPARHIGWSRCRFGHDGVAVLLLVVLGTVLGIAPVDAASQAGHRAHSFTGIGVEDSGGPVTGEKPESKLWFHDGTWWAAMVSPASSGAHTIHGLQSGGWNDTGVVIDQRPSTKEDVLSLGSRLYVVSRATKAQGGNRLRRFTYSGGGYAHDPGFPVTVPGAEGETVTIARDSQGTLWLAYDHKGKMYVARSQGDDTVWGAPFVVPVAGADNAKTDDIAAVIAFSDAQGPAVGVMWSNQNTHANYFAVHRDGDPDGAWARETALEGSFEADDHINVKTAEGRVYAAVKTGFPNTGPTQPLIRLLVRSETGSWSKHPVARVDEKNTRPIAMLQLDPVSRDIYVFMTMGEGSRAKGIAYKKSSMNGVGFPAQATVFIQGANGEAIDNATSAKQNATASSGIVVAASDGDHYWWNQLGGDPPPDNPGDPDPGDPPPGDPGGGDPLVFAPSDDAHIRQNNPSKNYGSLPTLEVRKSSEDEWRSYLRFNVTGLSGSATASLRLYVTRGGQGGTVHATASDWSEPTLTWANAPAMADSAVGDAGTTTTDTWVDIDLGTIPSDGAYSWALRNTGTRAFYSSKEGAQSPQLIVTP